MMIIAVWVMGSLIFWVPASVFIIKTISYDTPGCRVDDGDYIFGTFVGFLIALLWPISMPLLGVSYIIRKFSKCFGI